MITSGAPDRVGSVPSLRTLLAVLCGLALGNEAPAQPLKAIEPLSAAEFAGILKGALQEARSFEILSLDWKDLSDPSDADRLEGWRVLGKAEASAEERERLVDTLIQAAALAPDEPADCFVPRHGIRITSERGSVALLICFTCSQAEVYSKATHKAVLVSPEFEGIFDGVFRAHGLPKAE